jgi:seryl-tRNA synthetase
MLDIKFIRENKELIALASKKKKIDFDIDKLILADDKRKNLLLKVEEKRADQKVANNKIVTSTSEEREVILEQMKILKTYLEKDEREVKEIMKEWHALMLQVPNIPDISVPEGESDEDNKEYKKWGDIPSFSFKPKAHYEIMTDLGLADFERGAKVSGFRGYFLKNDGVRLVWALERFVEDMFLKKGFNPMIVPSMLRRESFIGTGYLPQSEEDLYKTQDGDYLAGTAEVSTMGYYMDEVLEKKMLPLKFFSYSQCFLVL